MHMMCRHNVHTHHKPDIEQPMMCMYKYIVCECVHTVWKRVKYVVYIYVCIHYIYLYTYIRLYAYIYYLKYYISCMTCSGLVHVVHAHIVCACAWSIACKHVCIMYIYIHACIPIPAIPKPQQSMHIRSRAIEWGQLCLQLHQLPCGILRCGWIDGVIHLQAGVC